MVTDLFLGLGPAGRVRHLFQKVVVPLERHPSQVSEVRLEENRVDSSGKGSRAERFRRRSPELGNFGRFSLTLKGERRTASNTLTDRGTGQTTRMTCFTLRSNGYRLAVVATLSAAALLLLAVVALRGSFDSPEEHNRLWASGSVGRSESVRDPSRLNGAKSPAADELLYSTGHVIMPKLGNATAK